MKKITMLVLALVLTLGALGVGYAAWTDQIVVNGTVNTGELCFGIKPGSFHEVGGCPDTNWAGWVRYYGTFGRSCPPGYQFGELFDAPEGKCPADVELTPIYDGDVIEALQVTITNAYPHFAADVSFWVCNCGTIPLRIQEPQFSQNDFLLIQYGDNIGAQLHPGDCVEISFYVGVVQHEGYFNDQGVWIVDDPNAPILPQNSTLTFTITLNAIQWNEYVPGV